MKDSMGTRRRAAWLRAAALSFALVFSLHCANMSPQQMANLSCAAGTMLAVAGNNFGQAYVANAAQMMSAFAGRPYGEVGCGSSAAVGGYGGSRPSYPGAGQGYPPQPQYPGPPSMVS